MTKKMLWYVGLVLVCSLALVFSVQAASSGKMIPRPTTSAAPPAAMTPAATGPATAPAIPAPMRTSGINTATPQANVPSAMMTPEQLQKEQINRAMDRIERGEAQPGDKAMVEEYLRAHEPQIPSNPLDNQGGPDAFGYRWVDNLGGDTATYAWIELCGDNNASNGPSGDDAAEVANIGWNFPFYGGSFNQVWISTNGVLSFGASFTNYSNSCIPSYAPPAGQPKIFPYWDDLYASAIGGCNNDGAGPYIRYRNFSTHFVVEWKNVNFCCSENATLSFQVILYPDGKMRFQYGDDWDNSSSPAGATIGIDAAGAGLEYSCNTNSVAAGRAIWFYPGAPSNGRCCYGDPMNPSCVDNLPAQCAALGGTWTAGATCAANPCPGCADFAMTAPGQVSGNTSGAGDNCSFRVGEDQVVAVTIPTPGNWIFSLCPGAGWDTYLYLSSGCCEGQLALNDDFCGATSEITYNIATAGTYFLDIEPWSGGSGAWTLVVSQAAPPPAHDNCADAIVIPSLPYTHSSNNSGATNDCPLTGWPEVWYTFTLTQPCDLVVSECGSQFPQPNSTIWVMTGCPCTGNVSAGNWENTSCGDGNWTIYYFGLQPGTYYYPIYSGPGSTGPYTVSFVCATFPEGRCCYGDPFAPTCADMSEQGCLALGGTWDASLTCATPCVACDVTQPGGSVLENEPVCGPDYLDAFNGGCNSSPSVFSPIMCGQTVFGESGTYTYLGSNYRDTDWYRLELLTPNTITWTVNAEFPVLIFLIDANSENCSDYVILGNAQANACQPVSLTFTVDAGAYWLWVGPSVFDGVPCGRQYTGTLSTATPCGCEDAEDLTVYRAPGLGNSVNLRWNATQNLGLYRVFATDNKNNDGDPNNGSDPMWTLLSEVPAPATPGYVTFNHQPLVNYANYVVVHDCAPRGRCCYGDPMAPQCQSPVTQAECDALAGSFSPGLNCQTSPCTACADFTLTAPGTISGNTTGAGDDCPVNVGEEQVVAITIPTTGEWTFSLCDGGTNYDSWLDLAATCCGTPMYSNDDFCGLQSQLTCLTLTAGVYYLAVEGYSTATGAWSLVVSQCAPPPPLECPPQGIMENEPVCGPQYSDATNGGCNSDPPVFQTISCGQTVCGESGTYLFGSDSYRDTDWFELVITENSNVTWSVQAAFAVQIFTIGSPCPGTIRMSATAPAMEVASVTDFMSPGTYYLWVGPNAFSGIPCGSDWVGTVTCIPAAGAYCPASGGCDEYIANVAFGSINNSSTCTQYGDYTAMSTTLAVGQGVPITVSNGNAWSGDECEVFVDWNDDFDFADANEYFLLTTEDGDWTYNGTITAPTGSQGNHRMRIRLRYYGVVDPCGATSYGEVEDYTVVVQ